jgi:oligopeptide/dipeptide ABC transporter ATP-binding protein
VAVPVLEVDDLVVEFATPEGSLRAVDGVSFTIEAGETVGLVGESGCGKSVTALSMLGLVPPPGRIVSGRIAFEGEDLLALSRGRRRQLRGDRISMIFQDPMTALDPLPTIGAQISSVLRAHRSPGRDRRDRDRVAELLGAVGVPAPEERTRDHPHQWSGGMRQRALIAMAVANGPRLLIADEPTTALDVTVQAQVIEVLHDIRRSRGMATLVISHDLALVSEIADRALVMYAGSLCEEAPIDQLFAAPRHPYTRGLLDSLPSVSDDRTIRPIRGQPPSLLDRPTGCRFHPRCDLAAGTARCQEERPALRPVEGPTHRAACHLSEQLAGPATAATGAGS